MTRKVPHHASHLPWATLWDDSLGFARWLQVASEHYNVQAFRHSYWPHVPMARTTGITSVHPMYGISVFPSTRKSEIGRYMHLCAEEHMEYNSLAPGMPFALVRSLLMVRKKKTEGHRSTRSECVYIYRAFVARCSPSLCASLSGDMMDARLG